MIAFLVAPLAAPVVFWTWHFVIGIAGGPDQRRAVFAHPFRELAMVIVFGAPTAYATALVAFAIGFRLLRIRGPAGALAVTALGAAAGVVATLVLKPYLGRDLFRLELPPAQGALMGGISALCFRLLWTRGRAAAG